MEFSFTVGALLRGTVRRYLKEAEWHRQVSEWTEIKSFLDSTFLVRGATQSTINDLQEWGDRLNERRQQRASK